MKKWTLCLAAALVALILSACGSKTESLAVWTEEHGQEILASGAFSEELEEVDGDTAWALYRLEQAGLERESLTGALCRRSAGATCEELAVLTFDSEESAGTAAQAMQDYLDGQIESNRDYRPAEIPKLENALLECRENTLLLVVASDGEAARSLAEPAA